MEEIVYKIYERLGAFFTGTSRRRLFYSVVLVISVLIFCLSIRQKFVVSTDTLYWIFSSLVQCLVPLVALAGVLIVFKYQSMSSYEERVFEKLQGDVDNSPLAGLGGKLDATNTLELLENIEKLIGKEKKQGQEDEGFHGNKLRKIQQNLEINEWIREYMFNFAIKFGVYTFAIVLLCLIILLFTSFISINYLGFPLLFLIFYLTSYAFFLVIKGLAATLKVDREIR